MPRSQTRLKQGSSIPLTWLSQGMLNTSLLLRHESIRSGRVPEALNLLLNERISPNQVQAGFPAFNDPDKQLCEAASDDYLRCLLAKAIGEVYRSITPKYRNEAARKQFFGQLVGVAEACHLTKTNDCRTALHSSSEQGTVLAMVQAEADRLIQARIDLSSEYASKLNSARVEFRSSIRMLEGIVGVRWQDSERFQRTLTLRSFFPPGLYEDEQTWRWGSQWYPEDGVLNINPPILFLDTFRRGVLAREAAILLSPRILDGMQHAPRVLCEQSEYLAYKLFERKNEKELWSHARHGLRKSTRPGGQDLLDFFQYYEMLVGEFLYREIWGRLKEFGNAALTVADYYIIFNTLAARPIVQKFDDNEMRLLNLLAKRPDVRSGEAGRALGISIPTAMKIIRDLSKKAGLLFTIIVDMRKLGLVEYLLLLNTAKQAEVITMFNRIPYCRQIFRTYGSYDCFCVFDRPYENSNFLRNLLDLMKDRGLVTHYKLLELEHDFQSVNFDRYDAVLGRWSVHWDTWGIDLRERISGKKTLTAENSGQGEKFQFDKLDLQILSRLHTDCRTPFSSLGRTLGVSGAYIGKKVDRMLRENVFRYAIWPLKIGAEDWGIVVLSCTRQIASIFAEQLSKLPAWRGGLVRGDVNGLLSIVWAPSGELKQLFKAIDDRLIKTGSAQAPCLNSVGEWIIARWLPVEPYPSDLSGDKGTWVFDEKKYLSLASSRA